MTEPLSGTLSQQHVHVHAHVVDALGGSTQSVQVARRLLRAGLRWRRNIAGFVHARTESGLHQELRVRPRRPVRDDPWLLRDAVRSPALLSRSRSRQRALYAQPYFNPSSDLSRLAQ